MIDRRPVYLTDDELLLLITQHRRGLGEIVIALAGRKSLDPARLLGMEKMRHHESRLASLDREAMRRGLVPRKVKAGSDSAC